jgi:hypothetical protein
VAVHYGLESNADSWGLVENNGAHLADCEVAEPAEYGKDYANARSLWKRTEELVG